MIIRIALLLMLGAFVALLSEDLFLRLAMSKQAKLMTILGITLLLSGFTIVLSSALLLIFKNIINTCVDYFSLKQRLLRGQLFYQTRQERLKQRYYHKKIYINYCNMLKRHQLLRINNQQHINSLSTVINKDLLALRNKMPESLFRQLKRENSRYRKLQDSSGLLQLQKKIASIEHS